MVDEVFSLVMKSPGGLDIMLREVAIYQLELALKLLSCVLRVSLRVFSS